VRLACKRTYHQPDSNGFLKVFYWRKKLFFILGPIMVIYVLLVRCTVLYRLRAFAPHFLLLNVGISPSWG
jgi:hypothetical protein